METIDLGLQALAARLNMDDAVEVIILAPSYSRATEVLDALAAKVRVSARWRVTGHERLELHNSSAVTAASIASPSSMRGRSADLVVLVDRNTYTTHTLELVTPVLVARAGKLAFL